MKRQMGSKFDHMTFLVKVRIGFEDQSSSKGCVINLLIGMFAVWRICWFLE